MRLLLVCSALAVISADPGSKRSSVTYGISAHYGATKDIHDDFYKGYDVRRAGVAGTKTGKAGAETDSEDQDGSTVIGDGGELIVITLQEVDTGDSATVSTGAGKDVEDGADFVIIDGERRWRYRWFVSFLHPSTKHRTYTWLQAARQCARRGLVLASIENMKKDLVIDDLLDKLISKIVAGIPAAPAVWSSGTKRRGSFRWVTGQRIGGPGSYTNFAEDGIIGSAQPDNAFMDEYCLSVVKKSRNEAAAWHDLSCNLKSHFICERPYHYKSH